VIITISVSMQFNQVYLWNDSYQERVPVAASASCDAVEIYYAVEKQCSRHGDSCTVSSQNWFADNPLYWIEELLVLD
jgi:hypothetical protein